MDTVNHWPPSVVDCETAKLVTLELLLWMVTFCADGTVLPGAKEKLNELGVAVSVPPPVPVTTRLTGTEKAFCEPDVETVTKPPFVPDVGAFGPTDTVTVSGVVPLP